MQCLICGSETEQFYDAKMQVETYACGHCAAVFKDPDSYQDFARQKQRYDLHENSAEDAGYRRYFQLFLDTVLPHIPAVERALDFGCGRSTLLADMLREQGIESRVYDPIYHPDEGYASQQYDLITAVEVFEHLHDPMEVFRMLAGLLSPGGILAIRTAFVPDERERYLQWYYRQDPTHIVFYAPRTLQYMCEQTGMHYLGDDGGQIAWMRR